MLRGCPTSPEVFGSKGLNFDVHQLNASFYELYSPPSPPTMEILFFHGFQHGNYDDAHLLTWRCGDGSSIWPQTWLVKEFSGARVLTVAYNASVMRSRENQNFDMYNMAENLTSDLLDANIGQQPCCPIILVGHSFGGLVIKELCVYASSEIGFLERNSERSYKLNLFLENVRGMFFYSTPHHGITDKIAEHFVDKGPLQAYVKSLSTIAARLNYGFDKLCGQGGQYKRWQISAVGESLPTKQGGFHARVVVEEASSRYGSNFNIVEGADHISVCRPMEETSRSFYALTNFLDGISSYSKATVHGLPSYPTALEKRAFEVQVKLLLNLPDYPTTLERQCVPRPSDEHNCLVLGIVGMGGIGKTTIAKEVFNNISSQFEYTCFVENVKGIKAHELNDWILDHFLRNGTRLDQKLNWSDLLKRKVLIVMDDLDFENQARTLPSLERFGNGSRLILTTRDKGVLYIFPKPVIYEVDFLSFEEAKKLFCHHAFEQEGMMLDNLKTSNHQLEQNVERVVQKCDGLPLTLEVMGSYLKGHVSNARVWKETLDKLGKAQPVNGLLNDRVWASLRVSYDALSHEEQGMFIEAGIYFFGMSVDRALAAWSTAHEHPESSWANLLRTSMVKEVDEDKSDGFRTFRYKIVWVHEHLRDLANREAKGAMISNSVADGDPALDLFNADAGEARASILWLKHNFLTGPLKLPVEFLDKLENLKYMELVDCLHDGSCKNSLKKLSLLIWYPKLSDYWGTMFPNLPISLEGMTKLAFLELGYLEIPEVSFDALGKLSNLRSLILSDIQGPAHLPESFGHLLHLHTLQLARVRLTSLPHSFGNLAALEHLVLRGLDVIKLPESFGNLSSLATLTIAFCNQLTNLPKSFGRLSALQMLHIQFCPALNCPQLPKLRQLDSHESLSSLRFLSLAGCDSLERLAASFSVLPSLEELELAQCTQLKTLPESIGQFKRLERLSINQADHLEGLPDSFGSLAALTTLILNDCQRVERLPASFGNLSALQELVLRNCKVRRLPDNFGQLRALRELTIDSSVLEALPDSFGNLSALQKLVLRNLESRRLPDNFGQLRALRELTIASSVLEALPDSFGTLAALTTLRLDFCPNLKSFPSSFGDLSALQELKIKCAQLQELPNNFGKLRALQELTIMGEQLKALSNDFGNLQSLTLLGLYFCRRLERLPESFGLLSALNELHLMGCGELRTLPDNFGQLRALRRLRLLDVELEVMPDFSSIEYLDLSSKLLRRFSKQIGQLCGLRELNISASDLALKLSRPSSLPEELGNLSSLEILTIIHDDTIETLPESLWRISSLRTVVLSNCPYLKSLPHSLGQNSSPREIQSTEMGRPEGAGQSSQLASTAGFCLLHVHECPLLGDSVLRRQGWIPSMEETYHLEGILAGLSDLYGTTVNGYWYERQQRSYLVVEEKQKKE